MTADLFELAECSPAEQAHDRIWLAAMCYLITMTTPGWYPNPDGSNSIRYWDGRSWRQVARPIQGAPTPPPQPPSPPAKNGWTPEQRRTNRRWWTSLAIVAVLLVLGGVINALSTPSSDTQRTAASGTPQPAATTAAAAPTTVPAANVFSESMVQAHGVTKDDKGGQSNVRFVAGTDDPARIQDLQRQCVQHYLQDTKAAYCYGYANDADYALTTVEWTPEFDESIYGGGRPCWIAYGGQPVAGPPGTETTKSVLEYRTLGCPGGVRFPDDPVPAAAAPPAAAAVPAHDACALLDPDALVAGGFSDRTEKAPGAPESTAHGDILATYACGNADSSIIIEIDLHNSPQSARESADDNTSADQTFLIDGGTRVPFDANRGGAKIINTEFGISRVSWSNGPYAVMLEVMSDPVVPGLTATHPYERIDAMITTTVDHADTRLASGGW